MTLSIMSDPVAYKIHNKLQHRDNYNFLLDNIKKIQWKGNDRVVDIGSADGSCTSKVLKTFLPDDYKELMGVDRSKEMVQYANDHYGEDRVKFKVLEIGKDLDEEFIGYFDHVFSFFTLQFVHDHKKAFRQIYDMLSPSGDCLLSIVCGSSPYNSMYDHFSRCEKWRPWFKDIQKTFSPYYNCPNVEETARNNMLHAGFKDVHVQFKQGTYKYESIDDFKLAVQAINSIPISEELSDEYFNEHVHGALERGFIDKDLNLPYELVYIYGRK